MKTIWIAKTALALLPIMGLAQPASASCNDASLSGTFGTAISGQVIEQGTATNLVFVGTINFDGAGKISGSDTTSFGGTIEPLETFTGSYKVNADCTGTFKLKTTESGTLHDYFTIDSGGNEIEMMGTDPGALYAGPAKRQ